MHFTFFRVLLNCFAFFTNIYIYRKQAAEESSCGLLWLTGGWKSRGPQRGESPGAL